MNMSQVLTFPNVLSLETFTRVFLFVSKLGRLLANSNFQLQLENYLQMSTLNT